MTNSDILSLPVLIQIHNDIINHHGTSPAAIQYQQQVIRLALGRDTLFQGYYTQDN